MLGIREAYQKNALNWMSVGFVVMGWETTYSFSNADKQMWGCYFLQSSRIDAFIVGI